jgi:hypothetical protein
MNNKVNEKSKFNRILKNEFTRNKWDVIFGIFMILLGFVFFITFSFWIIVSKIVPSSEIQISKTLQFFIEDDHYCFAIPLIIPITFIIFYFRRTALAYFRHC